MAFLIFIDKSIVIKDSKTILIDCGIGIPKRIEESRLNPDALILSSQQPRDRGGLSKMLKSHPELLVIEAKSIKKRGKRLNLGGIVARPFKTSGRDVYGWKVKVDGRLIIYAPNTLKMAEKFLDGVDIPEPDVAVLGDTIHFGSKIIPVEDGLVINLADLSRSKMLPYGDFLDDHAFIVEEMERRGMKHDGQDELDKDSEEAVEKLRDITEKSLTYDEETEIIKENQKKPEAQKSHKFQPAEWTHKNGHPRCLLCGDEETISGTCDGHKARTKEKEQVSPENAFGLAGDGVQPHGPHICVCPKCGTKKKVEENVKCYRTECPKCGMRMRGSGLGELKVDEPVAQQFLKEMAEKTLEPGFWASKVKGKPRWWAISSTTHEDLEGETITRKALEIAHRLGIQEGFGPLLYEHVPKARIGECDGQLLVGDYLLETGTFNSDDKGQRGFKALSEAEPGKYKISIGFTYWAWSKVGKTYKAIRVFERSATVDAANPFTSFEILRQERKMLSDEKLLALKEIFGLDDDEVQEWLKDEGEEGILKVLKALQSDEGKKEEKKKEPKKDEDEEEDKKKKEKPPKKDEEEEVEKSETALKAIAKLLSKIEPEEVRSHVAKLLQAGGVLDEHKYGELAKKALEDLTGEVRALKSLVMERGAIDAAVVDGLIEATKEGNVGALEVFKTLLQEKGVKSIRDTDEDEKLTDEEEKIVKVAKKALEEVMKEKGEGDFDTLYNHPRFQSAQK
ncbi:MAG: hypothetical protein NWE88_11195 [Candidatus Bathyarchaeota archaeon]|nr:hypothetical protein [Candidatus Bathyarchaeota archaeon]